MWQLGFKTIVGGTEMHWKSVENACIAHWRGLVGQRSSAGCLLRKAVNRVSKEDQFALYKGYAQCILSCLTLILRHHLLESHCSLSQEFFVKQPAEKHIQTREKHKNKTCSIITMWHLWLGSFVTGHLCRCLVKARQCWSTISLGKANWSESTHFLPLSTSEFTCSVPEMAAARPWRWGRCSICA